ncbi:hypothetical protein SETIT_9G096700v2 [Setaria italica]|uniref:Uncharacterized protein n=1 Tax=Setaria italica TaxID=4555 RepID=A0A368SF37_SETIT|nr:hypothetical protein SETIT_9G096700v2 [Setaria italica]
MQEGERSSKRRRTEESPPQQQHLYLILDDWKLGYSIRKIDVSSGDPVDLLRSYLTSSPRSGCRLPSSASRRVASCPCSSPPRWALGSWPCTPRKIGATPTAAVPSSTSTRRASTSSLGTRTLTSSCPSTSPSATSSWLSGPTPSSCSTMDDPSFQLESLSWRKLPDAPFDTGEVMSYATLHDKQTITIFASVGLITEDATFSFQTAADGRSPVWRHNGKWTLPFHGPGYFVPSLNAWVGLSMYSLETGHICACDLVSASSGHGRCPSWKFSKEKLFSDDPTETHVGATLVYTGQGSRFCLLECVIIYYKYRAKPYNLKEKDVDPQAFRYLYRVTTFSLKYDENGDLTTGGSRRVRYYEAPKGVVTRFVCENPVAFWM